ncbi:palmitoyltransferase akr1, partial [Spiromyces aspiralis]
MPETTFVTDARGLVDGDPAIHGSSAVGVPEKRATAEKSDTTTHPHRHQPHALPPSLPAELSDLQKFMICAQRNDLTGVKYWVEVRGIDPHAYDETATALHWASFNGAFEVVKYLISEAHVDPNQLDLRSHASPVFWACNQGRLDILDYLLTHNASPAVRDSNNYSLLHAAVQVKSPAILLYLVTSQWDAFGRTIDLTDSMGMTPLVWAVSFSHSVLVATLLRLGADPNRLTDMRQGPLHFAVSNASPDIIEGLIKHGGDVMLKPPPLSGDHDSPIGAHPEQQGEIRFETPMEVARQVGRGDLVESIVQRVDAHNKVLNDARLFGYSIRSQICVFLTPFAGVGAGLYLASVYPWFVGVPFFLAMLTAAHLAVNWLLRWPKTNLRIQSSPYFTAVFQATAFYVLATWLSRILPVTTSGRFDDLPRPTYWRLNILFGITFFVAMWNFYRAMFIDPGFLPKHSDPSRGYPGVRRLLSRGKFDLDHFCRTCLD